MRWAVLFVLALLAYVQASGAGPLSLLLVATLAVAAILAIRYADRHCSETNEGSPNG